MTSMAAASDWPPPRASVRGDSRPATLRRTAAHRHQGSPAAPMRPGLPGLHAYALLAEIGGKSNGTALGSWWVHGFARTVTYGPHPRGS